MSLDMAEFIMMISGHFGARHEARPVNCVIVVASVFPTEC